LPSHKGSGAPSFAFSAKGGISRSCGQGPRGEEQWRPTLRQQREGWGTRSFVAGQKDIFRERAPEAQVKEILEFASRVRSTSPRLVLSAARPEPPGFLVDSRVPGCIPKLRVRSGLGCCGFLRSPDNEVYQRSQSSSCAALRRRQALAASR
jgi:hypothetical protein